MDEVLENIQKWFLIYVRMPSMWNDALCYVKAATGPMLVHRQVGV
jgi:hypothetical protein